MINSHDIEDMRPDEGVKELKPCPFCGGSAQMMQDIRPFFAECMERGCDTYGPSGNTPADAIAAWNRRATTPEA